MPMTTRSKSSKSAPIPTRSEWERGIAEKTEFIEGLCKLISNLRIYVSCPARFNRIKRILLAGVLDVYLETVKELSQIPEQPPTFDKSKDPAFRRQLKADLKNCPSRAQLDDYYRE